MFEKTIPDFLFKNKVVGSLDEAKALGEEEKLARYTGKAEGDVRDLEQRKAELEALIAAQGGSDE